MTNLIQESGKSWEDLTPEEQTQIQTLEAKAGLEKGMISAFIEQKPDAEVMATVSGVNPTTGEKEVSFIYKDKDGFPGVDKTVLPIPDSVL